MLDQIAAIYRKNKKRRDNRWTEYVCRPLAAVSVLMLAPTPITPNQVTFLSIATFSAAAAMTALLPGWGWLIAAMLVLELSYVLDCADGMLARHRGSASPLGHLLDFLMDELKAGMLLAAVTIRLYLESGDPSILITGLLGVVVVNSGISLTTFIRRPEYPGATPDIDKGARDACGEGLQGAPRCAPASTGGLRRLVMLPFRATEALCRFVAHYPSYVLILALVNRIDLYFWAYIGVNVLYLGRTFLGVLLKLGRTRPVSPPVLVPTAAKGETTDR